MAAQKRGRQLQGSCPRAHLPIRPPAVAAAFLTVSLPPHCHSRLLREQKQKAKNFDEFQDVMERENTLWKRVTKLNLWRRKGQIREQNEKLMDAKRAEYDAKLAQLNTAIDKVRCVLSPRSGWLRRLRGRAATSGRCTRRAAAKEAQPGPPLFGRVAHGGRAFAWAW